MHNIKTPASNFKERMTQTKARKLAGWISDLMQMIGRPLLRFTDSSDSLLFLSLSLARHFVRGTSFSLCAWGKRVVAESAEGLVVSFVLVASAERGDTFCTELRARIATFYAESSCTSNLPWILKKFGSTTVDPTNKSLAPVLSGYRFEGVKTGGSGSGSCNLDLSWHKLVGTGTRAGPWKKCFARSAIGTMKKYFSKQGKDMYYVKKGDFFQSRLNFVIIY
jgi:hypothetical protein